MYKLLFFVAFLGLVVACEKSGDNNGSTTQTPTPPVVTPPCSHSKPAAYDWDFYLEPSPAFSVVRRKPNAELKTLLSSYGTPCGGWYDGVSPNAAKNEGLLKNFAEGRREGSEDTLCSTLWNSRPGLWFLFQRRDTYSQLPIRLG